MTAKAPMRTLAQGATGCLMILLALLGTFRWTASAKEASAKQAETLRAEIQIIDAVIKRLDHRIIGERASFHQAESFYQRWLPEIYRCEDSDQLVSDLIVDAYALNLILMKKGVTHDESVDLRGRSGTLDRLKITLAGRYDRLVRYLDRIRTSYPFLTVESVDFEIREATVHLTLEIGKFDVEIPENDRAILESNGEWNTQQWAEVNDDDDEL